MLQKWKNLPPKTGPSSFDRRELDIISQYINSFFVHVSNCLVWLVAQGVSNNDDASKRREQKADNEYLPKSKYDASEESALPKS